MITLRFVSPSDWPALACRFADFTFEQSLTYAEPAARRIGATARFCVLEEGGKLLAAACVRTKAVPVLGRGIAWIAAGPMTRPVDGPAPDAATLTRILDAIRLQFAEAEGHVLRLRLPGLAFLDHETVIPLAAAAGYAPTTLAHHYRSIAIDLHKPREKLMADLDHKWRTNLRYVQKLNLSLCEGTGVDMQNRFLALFHEVKGAKGFEADILPGFHFGLNGPDYEMNIMIATKDGEDLAGIVIARVGSSIIYLFGATGEAGRNQRAGYFLTWEGIIRSQGRDCNWYDLGGIDAESNPDVTRFKTRMNGTLMFAAPFEARPSGLVGKPIASLILWLEALRRRMKAG